MHKAVGWVLRECGKKDKARLKEFIAGSRNRDAPHRSPLRDRKNFRKRNGKDSERNGKDENA
jgi:3-methyladenine DNA glycosylase AlkD